ncbi:hypothetical protein [Streptomyces viridochromogenes]|uniref:hypothetical protein n=1 Tax=Streptomyces viridochromogenes TaxID=1938 RepID=UPI000A4B8D47|nr:hypothetical protein [Streptomyces viridochromogenes]
MSEISIDGFAFAQFHRSRHIPSVLNYRSTNRESRDWPPYLYALGCALEERALLAQGIHLGIFANEPATALIVGRGARLDEVMRSNASIDEDWVRLPEYLSTKELLDSKAWLAKYKSDQSRSTLSDEFRSILSLRGYASSTDLESFYQKLLFASDEAWVDLVGKARLQSVELPAHESYPAIIGGIFDAVQLCANLLDWRAGIPLDYADPWRVSSTSTEPRRVSFDSLSKSDELTPQRVSEAARRVRSSEDVVAPPKIVLLEAALMLKVLNFARLPELAQLQHSHDGEQIVEARRKIIATLTPSDETKIVQRLGPHFAWASTLWRISPADERSLIRASELVELTSEVLGALQ